MTDSGQNTELSTAGIEYPLYQKEWVKQKNLSTSNGL